MKTQVTFQVLVDNYGSVRKFTNEFDLRRTLSEFIDLYHYEVRTIVVDGDFEVAFKKACEEGGVPTKNMIYKVVEE